MLQSLLTFYLSHPERRCTPTLAEEEIEALFHRYAYALYKRCHFFLRDTALAEDALQETFIRLMCYEKSFRNAFWLFRASYQVCLQLQKKRSTFTRLENEALALLSPPPDGPSWLTDRLQVITFLEKLKEKDRELFILDVVDGMHQHEIAQLMGLSRQSVNKKLHGLRKKFNTFVGQGHG
jgi:RNA polymerase sigma-70 factor (ECF subfamily)